MGKRERERVLFLLFLRVVWREERKIKDIIYWGEKRLKEKEEMGQERKPRLSN